MMECDESGPNPRPDPILNLDPGRMTRYAELSDALRGLSTCIDQVIKHNDNNKREKTKKKKNAHPRSQSTRDEIHIRSML